MRVLEANRLGPVIEELVLDVSSNLPDDVVSALEASLGRERSDRGKVVTRMILENARHAADLHVPVCQDTGAFTIFLDLAGDTAVKGDLVKEASAAVARATARGFLRPSMVEDPAGDRRNTGDNTPATVEVTVGRGGETRLAVMAKGGGCQMASSLAMLPPGAGWAGVTEHVTGVVERYGAGSCPPLVLGLGIGGGFDTACGLAARALLRPLDEQNPSASAAEREERLRREVNRLGIGPGGLGGTTTCLGVRIEEAPCHIATLPVALSISCHALRRKAVAV